MYVLFSSHHFVCFCVYIMCLFVYVFTTYVVSLCVLVQSTLCIYACASVKMFECKYFYFIFPSSCYVRFSKYFIFTHTSNVCLFSSKILRLSKHDYFFSSIIYRYIFFSIFSTLIQNIVKVNLASKYLFFSIETLKIFWDRHKYFDNMELFLAKSFVFKNIYSFVIIS